MIAAIESSMDPDAFITIAFVSLVAVFALIGAVLIQHERRRDAAAARAEQADRPKPRDRHR